MNFDLTNEHQMIRKEVRRFAQTEIEPRVAEFDETGEYPYEIMKKMGKLGFMGIPFPEEYGGMGGEWVISGTKQFITNIGLDNASIIVATAKILQEDGKGKIATFIVPKDASGFELGKATRKWPGPRRPPMK